MNASIKMLQDEFHRTMPKYKEQTKRDINTILNTKAYYISCGAVGITFRAEKEALKAELESLVGGGKVINKKRVMVSRFHTSSDKLGQTYQVPLASLLENASRGKRGLKGLFGDKMRRAVNSFVARRVRSIGFEASGFIPAVKDFEPYAERKGKAPKLDNTVKQYGKAKGSGTVAKSNDWTAQAIITNTAASKSDRGGAERVATQGLARAFADEIASMKQYIEEKMQATADKHSAKH